MVEGIGARLKHARLQTAVRLGQTVSQERMAELVSKTTGSPLWQAQWSFYELGKAEPPLAVIQAAAELSGLEASYLAFGAAPHAAVEAKPTEVGELVAVPAPHPRRALAASQPTKRRKGQR